MDLPSNASGLVIVLQILAVDVLLGSDNALMIALACRDLPPKMRKKAMMLGSVGAFVARVVLTLLASVLLDVPVLRLVGGVLLALIALNLAQPQDEQDHAALPENAKIWSVGIVIILADLVMSLDNVVALAAVARDNWAMLGLGLVLSIPALMFGATILTALLNRHSWLIRAGAALLGWIAGDLAISDQLISGWVAVQSPALTVVVPALVAAAVLLLPGEVAAVPRQIAHKVAPKHAAPPKIKAPSEPLAPLSAKPVQVAQIAPVAQAPQVAQAASGNQERYVMIAFLILFLVVGLLLGSVVVFGGGTV